MSGPMFFTLFCIFLMIVNGDRPIVDPILGLIVFFVGIPAFLAWLREQKDNDAYNQTLNARSSQCRRCGQMVRPHYQSNRGTASYNCQCGQSWTIRW